MRTFNVLLPPLLGISLMAFQQPAPIATKAATKAATNVATETALAAQLKPESGTFAIPARPAEIPGSIRIVSFNVHLGKDLEALRESFEQNEALCQAGIILLQEIESYPEEQESRTRKLARLLKLHYVYAPAREQERDGLLGTHGLALLSRFPLSDVQVLRLPAQNIRFGARRRIALGVTVQAPGGRLRIYNLHLDTRINAAQRLEQLRPVVEAARDWKQGPVVIGGDFNTNPLRWLWSVVPWFRSDQAAAVDEYMMRESYAAPLAGSGSTSNRRLSRFRLDSIFAHGAEVQGEGVERDVNVSDHFPVWIDLEWPPAER